MSVVGISMVRDEADIIEHTVRHMLTEVDAVIVADNGSVDGTSDILHELHEAYGDRVLVHTDPEVAYYQSRKMSDLACIAARLDAEWVVPFDADEWWCSQWGRVGDVLLGLPDEEGIALAELFDHRATVLDDPAETDPYRRMRWRSATPAPLPKVAVRPVARVKIAQGNHGAEFVGVGRTPNPVLTVHHFPWRSPEQMVRKAVNGKDAYDHTVLPETEGAHWRSYGRIVETDGPEALHEVFHQWFWSTDPKADGLIEHPVG